MLNYGASDNQKFAILICPENYDLIAFMRAPESRGPKWKDTGEVNIEIPDWLKSGEEDGNYFTYTISARHQQSVANRKIETPEEIEAPWNKLNPPDRKIAFVG